MHDRQAKPPVRPEPAAPRRPAPQRRSEPPPAAIVGSGAGNHALARVIAQGRLGQPTRPLLQRQPGGWHTIGAVALDLAGGDAKLADAYARLLSTFHYGQITNVIYGLGVARASVLRIEHALRFLDAGASEDEARFALQAAALDVDLFGLMGTMLKYPGQQAAVEWALTSAGIVLAKLGAYLADAKALNYDMVVTDAYYAAGILPAYPVAQIARVVADLGVPVVRVDRVGLVLRFLRQGGTDAEARPALAAAAADADLATLLAVLLDHLGQPAAIGWALAKTAVAAQVAIVLDHAKALRYDTALTDAYYAAAVLPGASIAEIQRAVALGAPLEAPVRVALALRLLAAGASEAETRYALKAAAGDKDLQQLVLAMIPHLGQLAAIQWAMMRAGGDCVRAAAYLNDARAVGYDTDLVDWSRKTGSVEAERVRQAEEARIALDLQEREKALRPAVTEAEEALEKIAKAWTKKGWQYKGGPEPTGTARRGAAPGNKAVETRTAAETAVQSAEGAVQVAQTQAESSLQAAEAGKAATEQAFVDLVAAYVRAGVSAADAQALYAQLGGPDFRALFAAFGTDVGALVAALGVPLVAAYLKLRPARDVAPLVVHLTPARVASIHATLPSVGDVLELWTVFGTQLGPLIAFAKPAPLYRLTYDYRESLVRLFKASGGQATALLQAIGEGPFEWLLRGLRPADIVDLLAHGVPAARLQEIGQPTRIKTFAVGCASDRPSLINLCNAAAVSTPQIVRLIDLCSGKPTLARVVTALGLARNAASLITILELQDRAGLTDTDVDTMLTHHTGLPAPARDIEHDVYFRLACDAQNEVRLDGPGLQLLLSPNNVHYPATITFIEYKHTSYDAPGKDSEMYDVAIPNPAGSGIAVIANRGWQIHLHQAKGGGIASGSIKKWTQRYQTGAGVYRGILPKELEDLVRSYR